MSEPYSPSEIESKTPQAVTDTVSSFYNTYPFPPEPLLDEAPPGYNWRWHWGAVHAFCTGQAADLDQPLRILDAGCGTGVSTEYLAHLNPQADIVAIDISPGALQVAEERCRRSRPVQWGSDRLQYRHLSLYDVAELPGTFQLINSVGVIHHLGDPQRGLQALSEKLAPGGLLHIFVYSELGRREIQLMQEAIQLLQPDRQDYRQSVQVGRDIFATLPAENRLVKRERERWFLENQRDECFADMYVHPHEVDYSIPTLQSLLEATDLTFLGFSNAQEWDLEPLLGQNPALLDRALKLDPWQRYRLREILDPDAVTHYEFFLGKPPLSFADWQSDQALAQAIVSRNPCMHGWPSQNLFNQDYLPITLSEAEFQFLQACEVSPPQTIAQVQQSSGLSLEQVRELLHKRLIWLKV
ncbi:MAG: class I SAM-dependent methyltransferase [Prochlorotrichaceae cyanobacterium]|jgi:SAM-dependent methyltransferase